MGGTIEEQNCVFLVWLVLFPVWETYGLDKNLEQNWGVYMGQEKVRLHKDFIFSLNTKFNEIACVVSKWVYILEMLLEWLIHISIVLYLFM